MIRALIVWARLIFMLPTHRIIRLAPGMYIQAKRGMSDAQIVAMVAAYLRNVKGKRQ